jgi:hypothetical protein
MKRSTLRSAAASTVLLLGVVAGCGGDDGGDSAGDSAAGDATSEESASSSGEEESPDAEAAGGAYCDELERAQSDFADLGSDFGRFEEIRTTAQGIADAAPSEVSGQWDQLVAYLDDVETALQDAGITPDEVEGLAAGTIPQGVDIKALEKAFTKLETQTQELSTATESIEKHAKSECGIDLGGEQTPAP